MRTLQSVLDEAREDGLEEESLDEEIFSLQYGKDWRKLTWGNKHPRSLADDVATHFNLDIEEVWNCDLAKALVLMGLYLVRDGQNPSENGVRDAGDILSEEAWLATPIEAHIARWKQEISEGKRES